jgi:hypothetical protein
MLRVRSSAGLRIYDLEGDLFQDQLLDVRECDVAAGRGVIQAGSGISL